MIAHTETETIMVPDLNRFRSLPADARAVPLRGFAYVRAVFQGTVCVGWIDTADLQK